MKTIGAILAVLCLAQCALAAVVTEECSGATFTECSAVATLQIEVTQGKCSGTSSANCNTWTQSEKVYQEAFEEWWSDGDTATVCDGNTVEAAVKSVARAIAKVWTSAAVDVKCENQSQGFACGWSFGNGKAFGVAVAEAVAIAAADASVALESKGKAGADVADAFCFTDVRAIGATLAEAASKAQADACTDGVSDPVSVYEDSFSLSINEVVADAFASASARVCISENGAGGEDVSASSLCKGEGEVATDQIFAGDGDFCFGFDDIPACEGVVESTCCGKQSSSCFIPNNTCPGCNGLWKKTSTEPNQIWDNSNKELRCFCKDN